jgi:hypothetical protein
MTSLTSIAPANLIDALRGDRALRPPCDTTSAPGLRAQLEDGIFDILGSRHLDAPVVIRSSSLHQDARTIDLGQSRTSLLRGVLVGHLVRLVAIGVPIENAFNDAVSAWRVESGGGDLMAHLASLDDDERARLATDVTAHAVTLTQSLGALARRWPARTAVRTVHRLAGGRVVLRDVVDLVIGPASRDVSSVVLLDVTTSPLGARAERVLRYHALLETLRSSVVPLRSATFSTATGELWTRDVEQELLNRSVEEVLAVIDEQHVRQ